MACILLLFQERNNIISTNFLNKIKDDCPYIVGRAAGDESWDFCEVNGKPCLLMSGSECDIYNEWLRENDLWSLSLTSGTLVKDTKFNYAKWLFFRSCSLHQSLDKNYTNKV